MLSSLGLIGAKNKNPLVCPRRENVDTLARDLECKKEGKTKKGKIMFKDPISRKKGGRVNPFNKMSKKEEGKKG